MKSFRNVKDALVSVLDDKVYHFQAPDDIDDKYCVWMEESEGSNLSGNNSKAEYSTVGEIRYFTREEYDNNVEKIESALNNVNISYFLLGVEFDTETGMITYIWDIEVI